MLAGLGAMIFWISSALAALTFVVIGGLQAVHLILFGLDTDTLRSTLLDVSHILFWSAGLFLLGRAALFVLAGR
ncbi:MAG: hypothetical protein AAGK37_15205 [Pseudomonadota bacterium]